MTTTPAAGERPLRIVIVGHVDHGKSTLVGRLVHDTGALPEGQFEAIRAMSERRGMPFEWAFLLDAIQAERDQGITIDTTRVQFRTARRPYLVIDAPGHKEFLKNMITGAASAEAALLVIDAKDGVREQSRRHGLLLSLLGIRQVAVLVNKMDLVGWSEQRFRAVEAEYRAYLQALGVAPLAFLPIAAREGANLTTPSPRLAWHDGPTVTGLLDRLEPEPSLDDRPLRLPVQDVLKLDERRIIVGRIEQGRLRVGDEILFSPSNKTARVASLEAWSVAQPPLEAGAGRSVGITLDEPIFVERGDVASHRDRAPILSNVFRARVFWLGAAPLARGDSLTLKLGTASAPVTVVSVDRVIDAGDLVARDADSVGRHEIAEVTLRTPRLLALDEAAHSVATGRFVLVRDHRPVGGGLVSMEGYPDQRAAVTVRATNVQAIGHAVSRAARAARNGHQGGVLWLTGLSGAGKSTLALALEQALFARGWQVYVLDGDNMRTGLNADLGFSPEDRAENIRRVGEVSALFADAGFVVISSFISPYRADRERARQAAGEAFREIWIKADLATCEARDPKGLYEKARRGLIRGFTGIDSPYEPPESPDLVVATDALGVEEALAMLVGFVEREFR
jgi:bifunctional enzyme CysN/CysC